MFDKIVSLILEGRMLEAYTNHFWPNACGKLVCSDYKPDPAPN